MIPGGLMHFNWPRLLGDKPIYRVYPKTYHSKVIYAQKGSQWRNGKCNIFIRTNYVVEITY